MLAARAGDPELLPFHRAVVAPQRSYALHAGDGEDLGSDHPFISRVHQFVDPVEAFTVAAQTLVVVEAIGLQRVDDQIQRPVMQFVQLPALVQQEGQVGLPPLDLQPGAPPPPEQLDPSRSQAVAQCERYEWC